MSPTRRLRRLDRLPQPAGAPEHAATVAARAIAGGA
jgi:hypothetical protein